MNKRTYTQTRENLTEQLAAAKDIVLSFAVFNAQAEKTGGLADGIGEAWNAAHDMVTSIESEIRELDGEWDWRDVPAATRQLVSDNVD